MDRTNPLFDKAYPEWKKTLWGALRAFVAGFVGALATFLLTANGDNVMDTNWWLRIVLVGSMVGGIIGLGKFLRSTFPASTILARLPI